MPHHQRDSLCGILSWIKRERGLGWRTDTSWYPDWNICDYDTETKEPNAKLPSQI